MHMHVRARAYKYVHVYVTPVSMDAMDAWMHGCMDAWMHAWKISDHIITRVCAHMYIHTRTSTAPSELQTTPRENGLNARLVFEPFVPPRAGHS